jgi:C1A family cysteine protease
MYIFKGYWRRWSMCVVFVVMAVMMNFGEAEAVSDEVAEIQEAIERTGGTWIAGDNWIIALSPEERQKLHGGLEPLPADLSAHDVIIWQDTPDPRSRFSSFDWRNHNGSNWLTSVKNQRNCGSCGAFAACAAVEAGYRIASSNPNLAIDLSEQHLFSCGGGSCAHGWYLNEAMDYFVSPGVPDESCLPYSESDSNCHETCGDWQSRAVTISSWSWVTQATSNETAIKNAVAVQPVPCRMEIYEDFYAYSSGVYTYAYGTNRGGHFVVIVGWNDAENSWICKNSWGTGWGESGYFRIRRDQVVIGTYSILPSIGSGPSPTPTPPPSNMELYFRMPSTWFVPGDLFYTDVIINNTGPAHYNATLFVALNIYNDYWFWPLWYKHPNGLCWGYVDIQSGAWYWVVLPSFYWPQGAGALNPVHFIGVALDSSMTHTLTNIGMMSWGFGY